MVALKLIGWGCLILGGLLIVAYPSATANQPDSLGKAGVLIGIVLIGVGLLLIKL